MKISILSMQRVYNYGSFLQAYGLKKMIEEMGHEVHFLDIKSGIRQGILLEKGTTKKDHKRTYDKYIIRRFLYKLKAKQRNQMFRNEWIKTLGLDENFCYERPCDLAIIGSDEVFNCNRANPWGISLQLFGNIACAKRVISYAASCGYSNYDDIPEAYLQPISNALSNLYSISVRDKNTYDFVKRACGRDSIYNLDPVLIYDFKKEMAIYESASQNEEKYMIVYAYKNRFKNKQEIEIIRKYAKNRHLKIVSLGDSQYWADAYKVLNPFELLCYFKNAECILTDTFHGTIMAAKFHKKFAVVVRKSNENKLMDLIERLELKAHLVESFENIDQVFEYKDSYVEFDKILEENKVKTQAYFFEAGL